MLKQPHLLIAGSSGSGKSVLLNTLVYTALYSAPTSCGLILIDPKRIDLKKFNCLPHCIRYASEPDEIAATLAGSVELMENRYKNIDPWQERSTERDIYIFIDEFADLMTTQKRQTLAPLQRLAQLGRAANLHLITATQRPTKDIINGQIKVNMDSRLALRCPTAQDSRNIINTKGAETLPRFGFGYYLTPETITPQLVKIPYTDPAELAARVKWWTDQNTTRRRWWHK